MNNTEYLNVNIFPDETVFVESGNYLYASTHDLRDSTRNITTTVVDNTPSFGRKKRNLPFGFEDHTRVKRSDPPKPKIGKENISPQKYRTIYFITVIYTGLFWGGMILKLPRLIILFFPHR